MFNRLYKLSDKDIEKWRKARMEFGQKKYGERDLKRYNLVDVMEELLDCLNILDRMEHRAEVQFDESSKKYIEKIINKSIRDNVNLTIKSVLAADQLIIDSFCTDDNGDKRIYIKDLPKTN